MKRTLTKKSLLFLGLFFSANFMAMAMPESRTFTVTTSCGNTYEVSCACETAMDMVTYALVIDSLDCPSTGE